MWQGWAAELSGVIEYMTRPAEAERGQTKGESTSSVQRVVAKTMRPREG